jgi:hypothetical protein
MNAVKIFAKWGCAKPDIVYIVYYVHYDAFSAKINTSMLKSMEVLIAEVYSTAIIDYLRMSDFPNDCDCI